MPVRKATVLWHGPFPQGKGEISLGSGSFSGPFTYASRFEEEKLTNPEELIAGAIAACFSMELGKRLTESGHPPVKIHTRTRIHLEEEEQVLSLTGIDLELEAEVPGLSGPALEQEAQQARAASIVSQALGGVEIRLRVHALTGHGRFAAGFMRG